MGDQDKERNPKAAVPGEDPNRQGKGPVLPGPAEPRGAGGIGSEEVSDSSPGAHTPPAPAVDASGEAPDKELEAEYAEAEDEAKEPNA